MMFYFAKFCKNTLMIKQVKLLRIHPSGRTHTPGINRTRNLLAIPNRHTHYYYFVKTGKGVGK